MTIKFRDMEHNKWQMQYTKSGIPRTKDSLGKNTLGYLRLYRYADPYRTPYKQMDIHSRINAKTWCAIDGRLRKCLMLAE